jgi:oligopeptidase A
MLRQDEVDGQAVGYAWCSKMSNDSPLFHSDDLPRFDAITAEQIVPSVRTLIERQDSARAALEATLTPTWEGLAAPLSALGEPLGYAWNVTHHLLSVRNSPALREAQEVVQGEVVAASLRLGQSRALYDGFRALRDSGAKLEPAQRRIVDTAIREAELAGVALEGAAKDRFQQIEAEMAEVSTRFSNNLLDATKAYALVLTRPEEVDGLPPSLLAAAAQSARGTGEAALAAATPEQGPWRITLEAPLLIPFMEHSRRRDLREQLYRAQITRASSGALDNQPLVLQMLRLRREQAALLGYRSFAEMNLVRKMARQVGAVEQLLGELRQASRPRAERDLAELTEFARTESGDPALSLRHWDIAYWAERLREKRYSYSEEALRPYFPMPAVLDGLFALARRLFGVTIRPADGEAPVWNADVRFFEVRDERDTPIANFYLDAYSRPAEKRGGAWVSGCLERKRRPDGSVRLPVAHVVCNQSPPVDGAPSLMTFGEVETMFHEFGHALQHMLTRVDYPDAAGTNNIEWDAVELPSQFMENWCYHRPTLLEFARHHQTGAPLPVELFERIAAARTYRAGSLFLRQLHFATLDLELHHRFDPERDDLGGLVAKVAAANTVLQPLPEDRFLCSFSHIFAGGYAAGYYSYKWAEVLSADAFGAFEEAGLDNPAALAATGRRFRDTVLALGGSRPPSEVFEAFRGRGPSVEPLLRQNGLQAAG